MKDVLQGKTKLGHRRDPHWETDRKNWLKEHGVCEGCGGTEKLEVHHKKPFHKYPEEERNPKNFITLCEAKHNGVNCHLHFGHLGNFKSWNVAVVSDAKIWKIKIGNRPKGGESA